MYVIIIMTKVKTSRVNWVLEFSLAYECMGCVQKGQKLHKNNMALHLGEVGMPVALCNSALLRQVLHAVNDDSCHDPMRQSRLPHQPHNCAAVVFAQQLRLTHANVSND